VSPVTEDETIRSRVAHRAALLFLALAALLPPLPAGARMRLDQLWLVTASGEHRIEIEVAVSEQEKSLGLMFRTTLGAGKGMLFPYDRPQEVTMWMRNTFIPLDMVFIRADGVVHRIEAGAEPMNESLIESKGPVTGVLELDAGSAARLGIVPGSRVRHSHFGAAAGSSAQP
jgi:uncharacterized membrane protein (UPF0127 family)